MRRTFAIVGAMATLELLLARVTGGVVEATDVGAAAVLWLALALLAQLHRKLLLLPLVVYGLGLLTPTLLHLPAWHVLSAVVAALLVLLLRDRLEARPLLLGLGGVAALALVMTGVDQHQAPSAELAVGLTLVLGACVGLGRWAPVLLPLALIAAPDGESWRVEGEAEGRDVVLITIDTLRVDAADDMRSVSWLENRGLRLQAQAPSPWTLPSMATLMTGLPPHEHGGLRVEGGFSAMGGPTLAEHYEGLGYDTAATAENPFVGSPFGFDRGFARFRHEGEQRFALPRVPWTATARPLGATLLARLGLLPRTPVGVARRLRDARELLAERRERPLFLWIHILDPHLPYAHAWDLQRPLVDRVTLATGNRLALGEEPDLELLREGYDHEVQVVDEALLGFLKDLGPDTVVVLTSDHGEAFGEHGGWEHGHSLYQELLSVPLVIKGLEVHPGPAGLIDVPKTLAGLGRGHDLALPRVAVPYTSSNPLYGDRTRRAVRLRDEKLILTAEGPQAYDLTLDPRELSPREDDSLGPLLPPVPSAAAVVEDDALRGLEALGYVE